MSFHGFRGQRTSSALPKAQAFSQAIFRDVRRSFDQHGRPWSWPADKATGMPCGTLSPDGWNAPWLMDQGPDFYVLNPDNTSELFLNYRSFVKSRVGALREFHDQALRAARKAGMKSPKIGEYDEALLEAMGQEPPRAFQLAIACEQENPWALGFETTPDTRLVDYLEGPSTVVDEAFENYDFGPASYAKKSGGRARDPKESGTIPRKFKSFEELRTEMASGQSAAAELLEFERAQAGRTAEDVDSEIGDEVDGEPGDDVTDEVLDEIEGEPALEDGDDEFVDDKLEDLEETADADALGGKRVDPRSPKTGGGGKRRKKVAQRGRSNARPFNPNDKRPTLADGARPVVSD